MAKIARGAAVFSDEFVNAMAEGKKLPMKSLDDIVEDVHVDDKENEVIDWNKILSACAKGSHQSG